MSEMFPKHTRGIVVLSLGKEKVKRKIDWMFKRISSEKANQFAKTFYDATMDILNPKY